MCVPLEKWLSFCLFTLLPYRESEPLTTDRSFKTYDIFCRDPTIFDIFATSIYLLASCNEFLLVFFCFGKFLDFVQRRFRTFTKIMMIMNQLQCQIWNSYNDTYEVTVMLVMTNGCQVREPTSVLSNYDINDFGAQKILGS